MRFRGIRAVDIAGAPSPTRRATAARLRRAVARILKKNTLCAIATTGSDGRVHINTAYFSYSLPLDVYFLSHPESQHCRNLKVNPRIAVAVFDSTQHWGGLDRGLQLFGECRIAAGRTARLAERSYATRFKPYSSWKSKLDCNDLASDYRLFRCVIRRITAFDEREFGGAVLVTAGVMRP